MWSIIHITLWCNHRQYKWKLPPALSSRSLSWQIWAEIKHKIACWLSQAFPRVLRFCNHRYNESITVSKLTSRQLHQPTIKYLEWVQTVRERERSYILKEVYYMGIDRSIDWSAFFLTIEWNRLILERTSLNHPKNMAKHSTGKLRPEVGGIIW